MGSSPAGRAISIVAPGAMALAGQGNQEKALRLNAAAQAWLHAGQMHSDLVPFWAGGELEDELAGLDQHDNHEDHSDDEAEG